MRRVETVTLAIEYDIPIPERRWKPKGANQTSALHPKFTEMRVGASIFVPGISTRAIAAACDWNRLHAPKHLETRATDHDPIHKTHGVRVWRTR